MDLNNCAVGRVITRGDDLGGLDWVTPCTTPPGNEGVQLVARSGEVAAPEFVLCRPHADVLLPAFEAARQARLRRN